MGAFATVSSERTRRRWSARDSLRLMWSTVAYDTRDFYRSPWNLLGFVTVPLVFLTVGYLYSALLDMPGFFRASGGSVSYTAFLLAGIGAATLGRFGEVAADRIRSETRAGTIAAVFTSAAPRWIYLVSTAMAEFVRMAFLLLVTFGIALVVARTWPVSPGLFALGVVLGTMLHLGLGLFWCGLSLRYRHVRGANFMITYPSRVISGVFIPVLALPTPFRQIAYAVPDTWVIDMVRSPLLGLTPLLPYSIETVILSSLVAAALVFGSLSLIHFEKQARERGLLES